MKFLTAFAILASAVSGAPHIVQLEMRDECVGKRFAVFAIDNSNTVDWQDPENVRYDVPVGCSRSCLLRPTRARS